MVYSHWASSLAACRGQLTREAKCSALEPSFWLPWPARRACRLRRSLARIELRKRMRTVKTLRPGQKGTSRVLRRLGPSLLSVRYRYENRREHHLKTRRVALRIDWWERDLVRGGWMWTGAAGRCSKGYPKKMTRIAPLLMALFLVGCGEKPAKIETPMEETKYKVGQVWNYSTREGEEGSRIFIVRADANEKLGTIYHIYVDGLKIKNPHVDSGVQDHLPHSPVSEKTLDESVTTLANDSAPDLPDVSEGYQTWKEAFDKGQGGIFTIPVSQIIQYIEDIVTGKANNG